MTNEKTLRENETSTAVESTAHLTMPAVPLDAEHVALDGTGRIIDPAVVHEQSVRRAYLTHPDPPDEMLTGLTRGDGSAITVGDLRREQEAVRAAARARETLQPVKVTSEVIGTANPTGEGDARTVEIVRDTVEPVEGETSGLPPRVVGADRFARTVAPEPTLMRSGESLDSAANTSVSGATSPISARAGSTPSAATESAASTTSSTSATNRIGTQPDDETSRA